MKYGVVRGGKIVAWMQWDGVSPHPYEGDELRPLPNDAQPREFIGRKPDMMRGGPEPLSEMTKLRRETREGRG